MKAGDVERRSISHIALAVSGAAVLGALVVLMLEVRSAAPRPVVDGDESASAPAPASATPPAPSAAIAKPAAGAPGRAAPGSREPRPPGARRVLGEAARSAAQAELRAEMGATERASSLQASPQEATRFYDQGDYDAARTLAIQVLDQHPDPELGEKMLRIATSASCYLGDADQARAFFVRLTPASQREIGVRCRRAGIEF